MRNYLTSKFVLLVFLICGTPTPVLSADATSQQIPTRIMKPEQINPGDRITVYEKSGRVLELIVEEVVLPNHVEPSMMKGKLTLDQSYVELLLADINKIEVWPVVSTREESHTLTCQISEAALDAIQAATIASNRKGKPADVQDLIYQSDVAASPPECDSVRAKILADKAKQLAEDNIESPLSESPTSNSPKSPYSAFSKSYNECIGKIAMYGVLPIIAAGPEGARVGIFTSVIGTVVCVPAAGMVISIKPSIDPSVKASSRKDYAAYRKSEQQRFIALTRENLARDMASGGGEYVTTMAYLEGCPIDVHGSFAIMTQRNFREIIPRAEMETAVILHNLETQVAKDPLLASRCSRTF